MDITRAFATYATEMTYERIPEHVRKIARRALIDTIGCAVAGSNEPAARIATKLGRADGGRPAATVIAAGDGAGLKLPPQNAAMINAIAGHALDYDDVNTIGHPSVPVVFTALAAVEDAGGTGRDLLTAYVTGVEVETKIMRAFSESHYMLGWHSTSTLGVLGAVVAAARAYGLGVEETIRAIGIAASQASGLRQNFGTMTKPFHPGHASWSGLTAVRLAREGFTADSAILEAPMGYFAVYSAGPHDPARAIADMGGWTIDRPGLSVKKYPCCYCTHATIDAALSLAGRFDLRAEDIGSIRAELSPFFISPLIHHRPKTGLEGKFSSEYTTAAAILDRKVTLATFTDPMVGRPEARGLLEKVTMSAHDVAVEDGLRATFARLTIERKDGSRVVEEVAEPRGTAANPLSDDELADKFADCCNFADRGDKRADDAIDMLWDVERLDGLDRLTKLLA